MFPLHHALNKQNFVLPSRSRHSQVLSVVLNRSATYAGAPLFLTFLRLWLHCSIFHEFPVKNHTWHKCIFILKYFTIKTYNIHNVLCSSFQDFRDFILKCSEAELRDSSVKILFYNRKASETNRKASETLIYAAALVGKFSFYILPSSEILCRLRSIFLSMPAWCLS